MQLCPDPSFRDLHRVTRFPRHGRAGRDLYEIPLRGRIGLRAGGAAGLAMVPEFIEPDFGRQRPLSYWLLAQARLR